MRGVSADTNCSASHTYNWYWLVDGLMAAGFAVHLANTAAIKQYEGLKYAGDERDAVFLAHIFRLGLLPEGYIYPPQERGLRDLARKRMQLVQQSTLNTLSIENILARQLNLRLNAEQVRHLDSVALTSLGLPPHIETALAANLAVVHTLQVQIGVIESKLHREVKLRPEFAILKTAPGIGVTLATTIMLETGTITRFRTVGQFSSYCRCVESRRVSNGGRKAKAMRRTATSPRLGLHRGCRCRPTQLPAGQTLLRAQESPAHARGRHEGSRAQARPCRILHVAGRQTIRGDQMALVRSGGAVSPVKVLA